GRRLVVAYRDSTAMIWDLAPGIRRAGLPARDLGQRDLDQLFADLASDDANRALTAVWSLVAVPEKATRLLRERITPVRAPDPERVRRLLADLDSPTFRVRDTAMKELEPLANQASDLFREALEKSPSLELRRRIELLLAQARLPRHPECLRRLRAIHVLEQLGTREARALLEELSKGAAGARETREAKAVLERLDRR